MRRGRDLLNRGQVGRQGRAIRWPLSHLAPRTSVTRWGGSTVARLGLTGRGLAHRSMADPLSRLAPPVYGWGGLVALISWSRPVSMNRLR
jgi:hypothetical protein